MKSKLLIVFIFINTLNACSTKEVYNLIQTNRQSACPEDLNTESRKECLKGLDTSFENYQREREAMINSDLN